MFAVFRRELKAYFISPIGFTFVGFFILITGVFFALSNLLSGSPAYTGMLSSLTFIFLFLVPILTMRLLSDEMRQKTDQLLLTSPLSITGVVLGKYLAAVAVFSSRSSSRPSIRSCSAFSPSGALPGGKSWAAISASSSWALPSSQWGCSFPPSRTISSLPP